MRTNSLVASASVVTLTAALVVTASSRLIAHTSGPVAKVPAAFHLDLDRSSPSADETVAGVEKISLWFTQSPQMSGTSIRLVPEGGEPMDLGKAQMSESDDKLIEIAVPMDLESGKYGVFWRAMAQDGHTVRGDFSFQVQAER